MRFIEWIIEKRRHKKYHEIAAELGVHPSYLGHIKNGKFALSKKFAEKVEEVSGGLCKKEEIVFEKIDENEWKKYEEEIEGKKDVLEEENTVEPEGNSPEPSEEDLHGDPIEKFKSALC